MEIYFSTPTTTTSIPSSTSTFYPGKYFHLDSYHYNSPILQVKNVLSLVRVASNKHLWWVLQTLGFIQNYDPFSNNCSKFSSTLTPPISCPSKTPWSLWRTPIYCSKVHSSMEPWKQSEYNGKKLLQSGKIHRNRLKMQKWFLVFALALY